MKFELKLEPRDAWVGVFWDRRPDGLHLYVCPVPFLVFHWVFGKDTRRCRCKDGTAAPDLCCHGAQTCNICGWGGW
jgi:hypothetical protein